jgi:ABC-type lipoprotein release transport system permease subunit
MFYRLLGMAVWKIGTRYVRRNYARQFRAIVALIVLIVGVAGYAAARSRE